jgi:DNA-binding YbaB/EbfC family protein
MIKGFSSFMQVMKQAQAMQGRMDEIQARLGEVRVEGSAGGGMVTATADGQQRLLSCRIEPALLTSGDGEMLEELVCSAVNQALEKSRASAAEEMSSLLGGLDMPGLKDALSGLGSGFPGLGN